MIQKKLESFISEYLKANDLEIQNWNVSANTKQGFGDYSSNIALVLSKKVGVDDICPNICPATHLERSDCSNGELGWCSDVTSNHGRW